MNVIRRLAHSDSLHPHRILLGALHVVMVIALMENAAADDNLVTKALPIPSANSAHNWNGFYAGARVGYAWGSSNWKESSSGAPNSSGSLNLFQPLNVFNDTGSFSLRVAGWLQLHVAKPHRDRRGGRCYIPWLSR